MKVPYSMSNVHFLAGRMAIAANPDYGQNAAKRRDGSPRGDDAPPRLGSDPPGHAHLICLAQLLGACEDVFAVTDRVPPPDRRIGCEHLGPDATFPQDRPSESNPESRPFTWRSDLPMNRWT